MKIRHRGVTRGGNSAETRDEHAHRLPGMRQSRHVNTEYVGLLTNKIAGADRNFIRSAHKSGRRESVSDIFVVFDTPG